MQLWHLEILTFIHNRGTTTKGNQELPYKLPDASKRVSYSALLHRELRWQCCDVDTTTPFAGEEIYVHYDSHCAREWVCSCVCLRAVGLFDTHCAGYNIRLRSSGRAAASQRVSVKANCRTVYVIMKQNMLQIASCPFPRLNVTWSSHLQLFTQFWEEIPRQRRVAPAATIIRAEHSVSHQHLETCKSFYAAPC